MESFQSIKDQTLANLARALPGKSLMQDFNKCSLPLATRIP